MKNLQTLKNYDLLQTISKGRMSEIKLANNKLTKENVIIKIFDKKNIKTRKDLERIKKEIKYLKLFNHPHIVKLYETFEDNNNYYLFMEYIPEGELYKYVEKNHRLSEEEASFFYYQIILIIKTIHSKKIAHRDIKMENLLLTKNKMIKIIDFGIANEYVDYLTSQCGSPLYSPPEVINGEKYKGLSFDIWASGIILFTMLCGYLPFDEENDEELYKKILKCDYKFPKFNLSDRAKNLISRILKPESERINLEKILNDPFLKEGKKIYEKNQNIKSIILNKQENQLPIIYQKKTLSRQIKKLHK